MKSENSNEVRNVTMRQMCEHIVKAEILKKNDGASLTAEEIFNYSPTGELYMIFEWYENACQVLGYPAQATEITTPPTSLTITKDGIYNVNGVIQELKNGDIIPLKDGVININEVPRLKNS